MLANKYIIGGGITGLVWKFYHPEFTIISPDLGGMFAKSYMVWLHDTAETRKLLVDLGMEVKPKKSYIGYYHRGWIQDYQTEDMNLLLIQKKMSKWNEPLNRDFVPKTRDLSLSNIGGTNYMRTLDTDLSVIIEKLNEGAGIVNGFVTKIGNDFLEYKTTKDGDPIQVQCDRLVSTIAAPFFWKAYGQEKEFKFSPITNVIVRERPRTFDDRYEMVYYDDSVPYTRISHLGGKYALEFTGEISREEFQKLFPDLTVEDFFVVKQGRIYQGEPNLSPSEDIVFSGRFGRWEYGITTEHVVKHAIDHVGKL